MPMSDNDESVNINELENFVMQNKRSKHVTVTNQVKSIEKFLETKVFNFKTKKDLILFDVCKMTSE